jgi:hypothetical protein
MKFGTLNISIFAFGSLSVAKIIHNSVVVYIKPTFLQDRGNGWFLVYRNYQNSGQLFTYSNGHGDFGNPTNNYVEANETFGEEGIGMIAIKNSGYKRMRFFYDGVEDTEYEALITPGTTTVTYNRYGYTGGNWDHSRTHTIIDANRPQTPHLHYEPYSSYSGQITPSGNAVMEWGNSSPINGDAIVGGHHPTWRSAGFDYSVTASSYSGGSIYKVGNGRYKMEILASLT